MNTRIAKTTLLVLNILAVLWSCFYLTSSYRNLNSYSLPVTLSENLVDGYNTILPAPIENIEKGTYWIKLYYLAATTQDLTLRATNGTLDFYDYQILEAGEGVCSVLFEAKTKLESFEPLLGYNLDGTIEIFRIDIQENIASYIRIAGIVWLVILALDLLFIIASKALWKEALITALLTVIASVPLMYKGVRDGHDLLFHLSRIEGIANELLYGHFPVKISSLWMNGYGYSNSIMYGDIFLYIPAVLRVCGFAPYKAYKLFLFAGNVASVAIAYFAFSRIFKNEKYGIVLSFIYNTASYHFIDVYVRAAVGEFTAIAFLPLIALAVYGIYTDDCKDWKNYLKNGIYLIIGMSGVFESHILSTEMVCVFMFAVFLILLKRSIRRMTIITYALSVIGVLALNFWFIAPFLDYMRNVPMKGIVYDGFGPDIQANGADLQQYFSISSKMTGGASAQAADKMYTSPGIALIIVFIMAVVIVCYRAYSKKEWKTLGLYTLLSGLALFMSSSLFPWVFVGYSTGIVGRFLAKIQFPWRYLVLAILLLCLTAGEIGRLYDQEKLLFINIKIWAAGFVALSAALYISYCRAYYVELPAKSFETPYEIDMDPSFAEYLIMGSDKLLVDKNYYTLGVTLSDMYENGTSRSVAVRNGDEIGYVGFPVFGYKGYEVTDADGNQVEWFRGDNNRIIVALPPNYEGNLNLQFKEPFKWRIAEVISLISIAVLVAAECYLLGARKKDEA